MADRPDESPVMACCERPDLVNHDYDYPVATVNRMCLRCGVHWFKETTYSRAEWEIWVNEVNDQ